MEVRSVSYDEARSLVEALSDELIARYEGGPASVAHPEEFLPPYGVFFVVSREGFDVACGGLRRLTDEVGEIKRMYVVPPARGSGLSRVVLSELIGFAQQVGYRELWLETGVRQPEAIALYESVGFLPIAKYGQYKEAPLSRCYGLLL